ncbi:glycosyltransferase family 2 protein [Rhodopila sp.]|uniref:glycosyltransferase family 2 protein n=1 Tax=Rhodopila sp. TaxID=2480087 RepID=UPI002BCD4F05|nr:glycosyltransferase family 2 protein [Rhodopila sp.]HVZ06861.1 glycosyltransferase family 2 protein [Rhodopila sp.]
MPRHTYALVACARWEEAYIREWIEYHRAIGFDHIYLYSNDDDPAPLFSAVSAYLYGRDPFVTFRHWPVLGDQRRIYLHFLATFKQDTEWFCFLDIDEFIVLKDIDDIGVFMRDYRDHVDCLYFHWAVFGNTFRKHRSAGSALMTYLFRAHFINPHTKMLCRSAAIDAAAVRKGLDDGFGAFWHFLDNYHLPGVRCRDVLNGSTEGYSADFPNSARPFLSRPGFTPDILARAYIAHYQFKSEGDFMRRWRRGGFSNREFWRETYETGLHKEILAELNQVYDPYLAAYWHRYTQTGLVLGPQPGEPPSTHPSFAHANVALRKPAWASSVSDEPVQGWSAEGWTGNRNGGAANDGIIRGLSGFRTAPEERPWWIVDLLAVHQIDSIRLFGGNPQTGAAAPAPALEILASVDGGAWTHIRRHAGAIPGPNDGALVIKSPTGTRARFVMLRLAGEGCLDIDEVEVYGIPTGEDPPLQADALTPAALRGIG